MHDNGPCPYRLIRTLRHGALTAVFEGLDAEGNPAIIKQASGERSVADPVGIRRFEREIALCTTANHPGLARVTGHGGDWIAFERLEHPASDDERRNLLTTPAGIRGLIGQLAEILAYLHARGVVHRDVKPAHVMFRADQPVLIDLGIAGLVSDDSLDGIELVGSPAWMAPEQIAGAKPAPSADVWSLCAVGAALARGKPLFSGSADDVLDLRRRGAAAAAVMSGHLRDDPRLKALLESGLGPAGTRPRAMDIAAALRG